MSMNPKDLREMIIHGAEQQAVFNELKLQLDRYISSNISNRLKLKIALLFKDYLNTLHIDSAELFATELGQHPEIAALDNDAISHYIVISLACLEAGPRKLFADAFIKSYPQKMREGLAAPRFYAVSLYSKAIALLQERDHQEKRQFEQQQRIAQQQQFEQQQRVAQQQQFEQQQRIAQQQQFEQQQRIAQQQQFEQQQRIAQQQQFEQQQRIAQQQQQFAQQQQLPRPANASLSAMPASSDPFGQSGLSVSCSAQFPQDSQIPPAPPIPSASSIAPPAPPLPPVASIPLSSSSAFFSSAPKVPVSLPSAPKVLASAGGCLQDLQAIFAVQSWFMTASAIYIVQLQENDPRRNILEKINRSLQHAHSKEGLVLTPEEIEICNSSNDSNFSQLINGIERVVPALYAMLHPQVHQHKPK